MTSYTAFKGKRELYSNWILAFLFSVVSQWNQEYQQQQYNDSLTD